MDSDTASGEDGSGIAKKARRAVVKYLASLVWPKDREPSGPHFQHVGDGVCAIQMGYPQYELLVSKRLRALEARFQCDAVVTTEPLKSITRDIDLLASDFVHEACESIADSLKRYFRHKGCADSPRLAVKVVGAAEDGERYVEDLYRDHGEKGNQGRPLSDHSLFDKIRQHGQHEVCNNIPVAILKGNYWNARIDHEAVQRKKRRIQGTNEGSRQIARIVGQSGDEDDWLECWKVADYCSSRRSHKQNVNGTQYKSSLVVPITIQGARLRAEVCESVAPDVTSRADDDRIGKLIFGFLCLDHKYFDYFSEETDPSVAFIFADMLSLFLLNREAVANSECYRWAVTDGE